jgi:hypothetical protein
MQGQPYYLLITLCTQPDFQPKGAATVLLQWDVKRAGEHCILACPEASDVGYGLYARLGFKKVDVVKTVIDGELVEEYPAMLGEVSTYLRMGKS